jgi:hypothetical protein
MGHGLHDAQSELPIARLGRRATTGQPAAKNAARHTGRLRSNVRIAAGADGGKDQAFDIRR